MARFVHSLCVLAVCLLLVSLGARAAPLAEGSEVDSISSVWNMEAGSGSKLFERAAASNLWLRGRIFTDVNMNGRYDPSIDKVYANKAISVGTTVSSKAVTVASGKTDAEGIYDFRFAGAASGQFDVLDSSKKVLGSFKWPAGQTSAGILIPLMPPMTSTKTQTKTRTTTTTTPPPKLYFCVGNTPDTGCQGGSDSTVAFANPLVCAQSCIDQKKVSGYPFIISGPSSCRCVGGSITGPASAITACNPTNKVKEQWAVLTYDPTPYTTVKASSWRCVPAPV